MRKAAFLCALLILSSAPSAFATDSPVNRLQSASAQTQTIRALQLINQNQWDLARKVVADSRDPLASKLYYWMIFTKKNDFENYGRLVQFIRGNPEWPGISGLIRKAEKDMPSTLSPAEALAWFKDYEPVTADGVDRYMRALINSGQTAKAKSFFANWWATTTLSRNDQRRLFRSYSAYLDRAAHLRRFDTMLYRGQNANARAVAGVLGGGYPALAEARIALRSGEKGNVNALINAVPRNLQSDAGLLYERVKWRRKNNLDMGAVEILHRPPAIEKIQNPKEWWHERHILIRRMIERKQYQSAYLLASKHIQRPGSFEYAQAQWVAGWLALNFMKKPTEAYEYFEALYRNVTTPVSLSRGAYWAGKASEGFSDQTISKGWYEKAAKHSTAFYGQLAGAELGMQDYLPNARPPALTAEDKAFYNRKELVQAVNLFNRAGMRRESSRFLSAFVEAEGTAKAYHYAAALALKNGRTDDAVRISKKATQKGLFLTAQAYPLITQYLNGIDLEWALIHAISRQESVFDTKARSPAGALGLMQLMPATAKETARKLGVRHTTSMLTTDPHHNMLLGSTYLSSMVARYDGAYPMAIAAYNAGPGRVDKWLTTIGDPRKGEISWIDWMESIPIYETRNYVQRVLEGVYVYRLRLRKMQTPSNVPIHVALVVR